MPPSDVETLAAGRVTEVRLIEMVFHLLTGDRQLATRGRFIMVALDAHHRPTPVVSLT